MSCSENKNSTLECSEITEVQRLMAEKIVKLPVENNPIMTHRFGADPAVLVYNDTVYVYSTNEMQQLEYTKAKDDNKYSKINSLNLFASKDLVNWTDLGVIPVAGKNGGEGDAKWATNSWAPAIACKKIDGKGYIYFGGGHNPDAFEHPKTARCAALGADMISIEGIPAEIDAPYLFEDSGINKINNLYYYTYCANWTARPEGSGPEVPPIAVIAYMTSEKPLGPFTYRGWTLKNPGNYFGAWGNNHHWIFEFKGKHYIAYHAQTMEKQMKLEHGGYRGIFINEFKVNEDGSLPVQDMKMAGAAQVGSFNPFEKVPAASFHSVRNVAVTSKRTLSPVADGGYVCLKGVDFGDGAKKIALEVICGEKSKASLQVCVDHFGSNGKVLADIKIGKKNNIEENIEAISGIHDLYFVFTGNFELSSWTFVK